MIQHLAFLLHLVKDNNLQIEIFPPLNFTFTKIQLSLRHHLSVLVHVI